MSETPIGRVTIVRELRPSDLHLTIRGAGKCVLVVAGEHVHVPADLLLPVLHEVVRDHFPTAELPDVGEGPRMLTERIKHCVGEVNAFMAERQELVQRLAEAEAVNEALTERNTLLERENEKLKEAIE